jgi:hypothetical protein
VSTTIRTARSASSESESSAAPRLIGEHVRDEVFTYWSSTLRRAQAPTCDNPGVDVELLSSVVRQVVGASSATLLDWTAEPIAYTRYLPGRRLERIRGHALRNGHEVDWSVVLKVGGARREVLAYQSGLFAELPHALTTPTVFLANEDVLCLEDVVDDFSHHWSLAEYERTAHALGIFNAAYFDQAPSFAWLSNNWSDKHNEPAQIPLVLTQLESPEAIGLLRDQPRLSASLAALRPTLCHHDASQANLFLRGDRTVAIDWESIGYGPLGADIATLVVGGMRRGAVSPTRANELDVAVFASYVRGLAEGGWTGNRDTVRLGFAAAVGLRWSLVAAALTQPSEPSDLLARFVLERAAEAIELDGKLRV